MNLLHLTTRRLNIRACEVTPLDRPPVQHRQVPGFWNVAQHLETWASGPAFVTLSESLFANLRWLARAEAHRVIGPQIRQGNRISRQSSGYILLAELFNAGHILRLFIGCLYLSKNRYVNIGGPYHQTYKKEQDSQFCHLLPPIVLSRRTVELTRRR